jgi:hypothetical protein
LFPRERSHSVLRSPPALLLVAVAQAGGSSHSRTRGALVALRKTALGTILVDARGRTLDKDESESDGGSGGSGSSSGYGW